MDDNTQNKGVIQAWTDTQVPLKFGDSMDVRYKVFQSGSCRIQEIRESDGTLIRKQELPQGMSMGKISLEASLREILGDLATDNGL